MSGRLKWIGDLLREAGASCLGMGGFRLDEKGNLLEIYEDDEEDWPEESYCGDESQDGEDLGWSDCVWSDSECGRP